MSVVEIITGDDLTVNVTLRKDLQTFSIDAGATVTGLFRREGAALTSTFTAADTDPGADWANSLVVFVIPSATTTQLETNGLGQGVKMEVQVVDGGETLTWIIGGFTVTQGLIP